MLRRASRVCLRAGTWAVLGLAALLWPAVAAPPSSGAGRPAPAGRAAKAKVFVPDKFVRAFRGSREDVRDRALDDVERAHRDDPRLSGTLWQVIEPALKTEAVPDSLLRAVRIYAMLDDPEGASRVAALLSAADHRLAMLGMLLASERRPEGALERLISLREQPAFNARYAYRQTLVSAIARFPEPAAVDFLVAGIGRADGQLKYEIAKQLAALTGESFGGKSQEWKSWWEANRAGFRVSGAGAPTLAVSAPAAAGPSAPSDAPKVQPVPWERSLPQFFGTPIYAKRVLFVIDRSKSMLSSVNGVTRMEQAERELESAIRSLPDDAWFNIVAYNELQQRFQPQLVQAMPAQRSAALRFIYSLLAEGKTDCFEALSDALLLDPNLEAILFLSDGDPTVGVIIDRPTIVREVTKQNAFRRVAINAIAVDAEPPGEAFLKQLAADNFGTFLSIQ